MQAAAIRHVGPYVGDADLFERLFGRICGWAGPKGLMNADTKFICAYWDNPQVVAPEEARVDVCVTVPAGTEMSEEIESRELPGGLYAVGEGEVEKPEDYMAMWRQISEWVLASEYDMDDRPAYEIYEGEQNGPNRTVRLCLAVKPKE